jgi:hypothetical protein
MGNDRRVIARDGWIRTDALHQHVTGILSTVEKAIKS